ncbi:MAG: hypothetical protein HDS68_04095 [Bacteroidales bacterium]|nr:hypothetical protein [Bacteroidales bacterium]
MKKFYTLILAVTVAFAASATSALGKVERTALKANPTFSVNKVAAAKAPATNLQGVEKETANSAARIKPTQSWEDYGTVTYTEALMTSFGGDAQDLEVTIQIDESNSNHFRLVNPYKNYNNIFEDVKIDDTTDYYMEFTITGDYVTFENTKIGLSVQDEDGSWLPIGFSTQAAGMIDAFGITADVLASVYPDAVGIIENNVITYPAFLTDEDPDTGKVEKYYNFLIWVGSDDDIWAGGNMDGSFQIIMPGGVADPNAGWKNCGEGTLTDGLLCNFFNNVDPQTMTVSFQQSTRVDGVYRIINPYSTWQSPYTDVTYNNSVTRYMVIHCEEAPYVWVEDFALGLVITDEGEIKATSQLGELCQKYGAETVASVYPEGVATMEGRTITYGPTMEAEISAGEIETLPNWLGYINEADGYFGGTTYPMVIELPDPAGINDAVADFDNNAPVEYFNLQGVRVANPAAGELVIKRQGANVSKTVVR